MGAETFETIQEGRTVGEAFNAAVADALWWHGHAGYTGTIGEKDDYRFFDLPTGVRVDDVVEELAMSLDRKPTDRLVELVGESLAESLFDTYDDKWGPALALKVDEGKWIFCGWASA